MEGLGSDSVPTGPIDKSRVLTVKPLRCLVPIFPSQPDSSVAPQASQFAAVPPSGPYPPGAAPFFPFFASNESQRQGDGLNHGRSYPIPSPVPLNSFRTPSTAARNGDKGTSRRGTRSSAADEDGYSQSDGYGNSFGMDTEDGSDVGGQRRKTSRKKLKGPTAVAVSNSEIDIDPLVNHLLKSFNLTEIDTFQQSDSNKDLVERVLIAFNLLRRKIVQIDDSKASIPGVSRRADLRSGTIMLNKGARANVRKRIGAVPGVDVGDIFFFRMETCLVGLHAPSMAGIDYLKVPGDEDPVAVSIVSSGGYEDDVDDGDVLIYSGQGGVQRVDKQLMDQKLERGNLALEKSLHRSNEVRVIRGFKDLVNPTGKVYVYDGLYKIHESWIEKGKSGCNVFKYKLVRVAGQPEAFTLWKQIQQWRDGVTTRVGVILPDLTSGAENFPVCLVNDVDDEKGPAYFTYFPRLKYAKPFASSKSSLSCNCSNGCQPANNCPCVQRNGGYVPYTTLGVLLSHNLLVHECGPSCLCPPNCRNRASQAGLKVRLEVYKTKDKGWGLRSWDPIRSGTFICEYAGEVIDSSTVEENGTDSDDNYIFDATRSFEPVEPEPIDEPVKAPFPLIISAKNGGNVGRFMNHSCSPNVYWQPVLRENDYESYLHVGFYAIRHIPPMQELTYNYGMVRDEKAGLRRKKCLCGSSKCRGSFY